MPKEQNEHRNWADNIISGLKDVGTTAADKAAIFLKTDLSESAQGLSNSSNYEGLLGFISNEASGLHEMDEDKRKDSPLRLNHYKAIHNGSMVLKKLASYKELAAIDEKTLSEFPSALQEMQHYFDEDLREDLRDLDYLNDPDVKVGDKLSNVNKASLEEFIQAAQIALEQQNPDAEPSSLKEQATNDGIEDAVESINDSISFLEETSGFYRRMISALQDVHEQVSEIVNDYQQEKGGQSLGKQL